MAVSSCCECGKLISLSLIRGGNPVAKEQGWATSFIACPQCGRPRCASCVALNSRCPNCPGQPEPRSEESRLRKLIKWCDSKVFTSSEIVSEAWDFTSRRPSSPSIADRALLLKEKLPKDRFAALQAAAAHCYAPEQTGFVLGLSLDLDDPSEDENFVPTEFILALTRGAEDATPRPPIS
jgi:hypothetical protein